MKISDLTIEMEIDNDTLREIFGCSSQGGMRRSKRTNTLVLVSNRVTSTYSDDWDGDTLLYTGMGQKGDQSLTFAQNKTLAESNSNGVTVHLFEIHQRKVYTYCGVVKLVKEPYPSVQEDASGENAKSISSLSDLSPYRKRYWDEKKDAFGRPFFSYITRALGPRRPQPDSGPVWPAPPGAGRRAGARAGYRPPGSGDRR